MKARIQDVAQKSGVSVSTVSRYLNGGFKVSEEAKQKISEAVKELGYSPNYMARSLVKRKNDLIGTIIPDITSSFFSTILCSIEEYATAHKFNLAICNIANNLDNELNYLQYLTQMNVCGLIIMHERTNEKLMEILANTPIPTVLCSCAIDGLHITSIIVDDFSAAYDATRYLIGLRHSRIAYIGGDMCDVTSGQRRLEGFKKAMQEAGLPVESGYLKYGDYKVESGYKLMKELLGGDKPPTAVFAAGSDDMAVGALNCIIDSGFRVPDDFSIIGFDGSSLTEIVRPRLTTVQQPIRQMGRMAVETLINQMNGDTEMVNSIILQHKLEVRESCRSL